MKKVYLSIVFIVLIGLSIFAFVSHNHSRFEAYILRTEDGVTYIRDENPVFTGKDIADFDDDNMIIRFDAKMAGKMADGSLFIKGYRDHKGDIIASDDYPLHGISALGAQYPDRIIMMIDDEIVFNGYFETAIVVSYMPPGPYVRTVDSTLELYQGFFDVEAPFPGGGTTNFIKLKDYFSSY